MTVVRWAFRTWLVLAVCKASLEAGLWIGAAWAP